MIPIFRHIVIVSDTSIKIRQILFEITNNSSDCFIFTGIIHFRNN